MARAEQYREQLKLEIHSLLCTEKNPIPAIELNSKGLVTLLLLDSTSNCFWDFRKLP